MFTLSLLPCAAIASIIYPIAIILHYFPAVTITTKRDRRHYFRHLCYSYPYRYSTLTLTSQNAIAAIISAHPKTLNSYAVQALQLIKCLLFLAPTTMAHFITITITYNATVLQTHTSIRLWAIALHPSQTRLQMAPIRSGSAP
ncbi:MAG: hypothetical protein F6K30_17915 [Cyanothece sp. SIO2G6]|nr:hypothetical protein [Cyanothece sp. SIO2G6]